MILNKAVFESKFGFTLLEVLLAVAILALITGIGLPIFRSWQVSNDLDVAATITVQSLRRAQFLSQAVDSDQSWGVRIEPGQVIIFQGNSFATRNASKDESFNISGHITASGLTEVVFSKFYGLPQSSGTIIFSSNNQTRTVTINSKGTVFY